MQCVNGLEAVFAAAEFRGTSVNQYTWERVEAKIVHAMAIGLTAEAFRVSCVLVSQIGSD